MCQKTTQEELEIFAKDIAQVVKSEFNFRDLILLTIISLIAICLLVLSYKQGYSDARLSYIERDVEHLKYTPEQPKQECVDVDTSSFTVIQVKNAHGLHYVYYKKSNSVRSEYYTIISKK